MDSSNIRSLSQEQGKITKQPRIHTLLACGFGEVGQLRMRSSLRSSEVKEEEGRQSSFYSLHLPTRLLHLSWKQIQPVSLTSALSFVSVHLISVFVCTAAFLALSLATHAHMIIHCSLWCQLIKFFKRGSSWNLQVAHVSAEAWSPGLDVTLWN